MAIGDVNSDARGSGARYNDGKPDMSLIPVSQIAATYADKIQKEPDGQLSDKARLVVALSHLGRFQTTHDQQHLVAALTALRGHWPACARTFEYGKHKYAAWNWAKGMVWSVPIACATRHALAVLEYGHLNDSESDQTHYGHFMCNVVMLLHYVNTFPEGNDLPPANLFVPPPPEADDE